MEQTKPRRKRQAEIIFRIEPVISYPTDHEELVDMAPEEQSENARPANDYVHIFDSYDFSGKTIIPFSTHGGSGFAGTAPDIAKLEPDATVKDGLSISRDDIQDAEKEIITWVEKR